MNEAQFRVFPPATSIKGDLLLNFAQNKDHKALHRGTLGGLGRLIFGSRKADLRMDVCGCVVISGP